MNGALPTDDLMIEGNVTLTLQDGALLKAFLDGELVKQALIEDLFRVEAAENLLLAESAAAEERLKEIEPPAEVPKKRIGPNAGITAAEKPRLTNRLPRERGGLIMPRGDGLTDFERAMKRLGNRVKATKTHYLLDGRPCSAFAIMRAASLLK